MTCPDDLAPLRHLSVSAVRDLALVVMIVGASVVGVAAGSALAMWWVG